MTRPIPTRPSPSHSPWDAPGSPSRPSAPMGAGMGGPGTPAGDHTAGAAQPTIYGTGSTVRDLVWGWLRDCGRESVLASELTKGLCGPNRLVSRLSPTPRDDIRLALHDLAADGLVVLTTTARPGRDGRPGLRIRVINPDAPKDDPTHGRDQ